MTTSNALRADALLAYIECADSYIDALMDAVLASEDVPAEALVKIGVTQRAFTDATRDLRDAFTRPKLEVVK